MAEIRNREQPPILQGAGLCHLRPETNQRIAMVMLRITRGITSHFPHRVTEWVMLWPTLGMGLALAYQHRMFETSPSFAELAKWMGEAGWSYLVLACAAARLVALVVNGTFQAFPYSPHIRIGAAFVSSMFWFQFALGFLISATNGAGAWSAVIAYSTFVLLEGVNIYRAARDLGGARWKNS